MSYKLAEGGVIHPGGFFIPDYLDNSDWRIYQEWLTAGGVPEEAAPAPPPTEAETAHGGVLAWFESHPNAALLFNLNITALDTEIDSTVDALFPLASAANKNRMKLWMKTVSHSVRALSKREGFT